jgi:hypothetical protein
MTQRVSRSSVRASHAWRTERTGLSVVGIAPAHLAHIARAERVSFYVLCTVLSLLSRRLERELAVDRRN